MRSKKNYGMDVYINSVVMVVINLVALFYLLEKGVDLGITLPLAGANIVKALQDGYNAFRLQRQTNIAHRRINKITTPEGPPAV